MFHGTDYIHREIVLTFASGSPGHARVSCGAMSCHALPSLIHRIVLLRTLKGTATILVTRCRCAQVLSNDNDNDTLRGVPHPSNEGLALQARVKGS